MLRHLAYCFPFLATVLLAAALPKAAPIITAEELRKAAAEVPVSKIDFSVPEKTRAAEDVLVRRFFNQPEENKYSGVTSENWGEKWDLFSASLTPKARAAGLDSVSLVRCLRALNKGKNRQTMLEAPLSESIIIPGMTDGQIEADRKASETKYQAAQQERAQHPQRWYDENLAVIPVGAYLAHYKGGECWIIVCKWENSSTGQIAPLEHIMIWVMDGKDASVVAYVTCD